MSGRGDERTPGSVSARTAVGSLAGLLFSLSIAGNALAATLDASHQPWRAIRIAVSTLFLLALVGWLALVVRDAVATRRRRPHPGSDDRPPRHPPP